MSQVELLNQTLTLQRFPPMPEETPLQAWEAADEYLLQQVEQPSGPVLIFNDSFGALACALAVVRPVSVNDSFIAHQATRHNLRLNDIDDSLVTMQDSLSPLPDAPELVLMKIPKQLALLEQQLRALRKVVTPQTRIIAGAKARDIHTSTLALFEKILGPTTTTLAWKKARLIHCAFSAPALADAPETLSWKLDGTPWMIHNHASVFSRTSLDIGARFFMQHLPEAVEGEMVDLGCGNGVIGLTLLAQNPQAKVRFVDESYMAVASSRLNVETNLPDAMDRCEFQVNNALAGVEPESFHAVLCNPPFHQQHAITDHIAWQMFQDARRCLKWGGELRIVGNRHLDYFRKLKKIFGNCTTVATNNKFVVLKAVKLRKSR
ncbi:23S rRNA (guanine(1835)-N(2))-methyltransferase RlmG [Cronobacter malonaticus]|uniref:23S rRNA (guanine(1835)-N(2))-methyltransferase RlmG n=1 Tax=Cronobacter malonaticus TaxID=413503 RepID=UPI000519B288|nr:23S rRNA (guanine(1835)-N(2))-methyltransferase RlmG [Cronobacter malonaticus]EGT4371678.1 23S rRNA (guanine(1835)-N(2))-methyltransferase RlmG [Cronobacter malonaticus]ELY6229031.1 23S rRNA (guanine(1835)-N(2))-methyltransferase RlmG [Cronobacter malonaticus]MDI6467491.1 23S rRNA (guanine(1835)-N(2))-methyltransferase RlmG [Cronobacter malonaticus]MDK1178017.1 23S rRNA (guanine(1835)-N(2))-methyltransferase RlmG [Cronobacter malonaticus]MDK1688223.1 23S rRNA (guanine(1835)-N(2))-methyltran